MADTVEGLVKRLAHLVSLNEPANGGPYGGFAAQECVRAMSEAASALEALVVERDALAEALRQILRCEYDGAGLFDCVDNDGERYQSADLFKRIEEAEALLSARSTLNEIAP